METLDIQKRDFKEALRKYKINRPSDSRNILYVVRGDDEDLTKLVDIVFDNIINGAIQMKPLMPLCRSIGRQLFNCFDRGHEYEEAKQVKFGIHMIDAFVQIKLGKLEKHNVKTSDNHLVWFLAITDEDIKEVVRKRTLPRLRLDNGVTPWTGPKLYVNDQVIDIVKSAVFHNILHYYRYSQMPDVYHALNKLNATTWCINEDILKVIQEGLEFNNPLITDKITDKERSKAIASINNADRTAMWLEEIQFQQLVEKGYEEETAKHFAESNAAEWKKTKQFDHLEVISQWSKRQAVERAVNIAEKYVGKDLNFIYSCDSRGRIYAAQLFLNPQGDDYQKALLCFANPKPISTWDFYIHLANCAGQDKKSYQDRVAWVEGNIDTLRMIGQGVWSPEAHQWLIKEGIDRESKTRMQFIAACIELERLFQHLEAGYEQDDFLCRIPIGYDATNSGLQILSILGRDETIAPHVNITYTNKPGDVYQFIGNFVAVEHDIEELKQFVAGEKIWRKICKRNVMTKPYSATSQGMGMQQWEDRKTYGNKVTDDLTFKQCCSLGSTVYKACDKHIPRASALMKTFKQSVKHANDALVTWKLPSGFTAFQCKEKLKKSQVKGSIGGIDINLSIFKPTGIKDAIRHTNAIAPNIVHSLDAWLLTTIANNMPDEANLHFIHDQFGSDSCHGSDVMDYAKIGYKTISSRKVLEGILYQVSGCEMELPEAGSWNPEEIDNADYIVC